MREYKCRCGTCQHDYLMNEAVGACLLLGKDVPHHETADCSSWETKTNDWPDPLQYRTAA